MKPTVVIVLLLLCASLVVGTLVVASGGQACVSYRVTAPVVGTRSGKRCLPDPFSHTFTVYDCEAVPPAGVSACATVSIDTP